MTCVVGLVHNSCIVLGGDASVNGENSISRSAIPKVFYVDQVKGPQAAIGYTLSFRMGDLLRQLKLPEQKEMTLDMETNCGFLSEKMIPAIQKIFKKGSFKVDQEETGANFIIGYRNWVYEIQPDYSVIANKLPYVAIGSGAQLALGALHCIYRHMEFKSMDPEKIAEMALNISEESCPVVRGTMSTLVLPHIKIPR